MKTIAVFVSVIAVISARQFHIRNNCGFTIWPGIQGNPGHQHLEGGGFTLGPGQTRVVNAPDNWAGRFWARTNCDGNGNCAVGDCGNRIQCNGAGGRPPVTLAEITLRAHAGLDFYDVSLVDGYNIQVYFDPHDKSQGDGGQYSCRACACLADVNANCPNELAVRAGGSTIACKSACEAFQTDQYCCRGAYNRPETCRSSDWPSNYPGFFKNLCPDAYSYAYDDNKSTFTCKNTDYTVAFCRA